jgi:hypothetical protein
LSDLLRRVAALTAVSVVGISLLAPLSARSATSVVAEADRILDAATHAPRLIADRGAAGRAASAAGTLTALAGSAGIEHLAPAAAELAPAVAPMHAQLVTVAVPVAQVAVARTTGSTVWDRLAQCESSGNWAIDSGNGYYGGLQFSYATWHGYGGGAFADYPNQATREQQIVVAERLRAVRGYQPWPACRVKLGLP